MRTARYLVMSLAVVGALALVSSAPRGEASPATIGQTCSAAVPGAAAVTFAWALPGAGAQQTWLDFSLVPGFAPGWFQGRGPLAPSQTAFAVDGMPGGLTFYYRVNTLFPTGWREMASGSFVAGCGAGGAQAAPVVSAVEQSCAGNGTVTVTLKWKPGAPGSQWLDLSMQNNGFAPGTFVGAGPVGSGGSSFTWYGIARGATHFWRVNTLANSGWLGSGTGSFTTLTCKPPMVACVGYMMGYTVEGLAECKQLAAAGGEQGACIGYIIKLPGYSDKGACVRFSGDGTLLDCLLGLSGQSYYGRTSCRIYWERGG